MIFPNQAGHAGHEIELLPGGTGRDIPMSRPVLSRPKGGSRVPLCPACPGYVPLKCPALSVFIFA